ncbi:MAG: hypothetical protein ABIJ96_12805 [Elusimicrobiota bacterium]
MLAAPARGAQPEDAVIRLEAVETTALIGSPFEITGEADLPQSYALRPPETDAQRGEFEILSVQFGAPVSADGRKRLPIRIRAAGFALGEQEVPAMEWRLLGPDGSVAALQGPPVRITIIPPKPGEHDTGDIRDIKGPFAPPLWPWILLSVLLLLAAVACLYYAFWRKPRAERGGEKSAPEDARTFEEIALDEIEALPGLGLPTKEFYDRLSDIVRLYLKRRCGITALQMTSCDLMRETRRAKLDDKARSLMKLLLDHCDLAKFARHQPQESQFPADCVTAKDIIGILSPGKREAGAVRDLAAGPRGERP